VERAEAARRGPIQPVDCIWALMRDRVVLTEVPECFDKD
jgi:hypothetical protein